jgi:hypothetical protein
MRNQTGNNQMPITRICDGASHDNVIFPQCTGYSGVKRELLVNMN